MPDKTPQDRDPSAPDSSAPEANASTDPETAATDADAERVSTDDQQEGSDTSDVQTAQSAGRRRWVDYPRAERSGWKRWIPSWRLVLGTVVTAGLLAVAALAAAVLLVPLPQPNEIARAQVTTFYWSDGTSVLGQVGANRTDIEFSQIPENTQQAVLAAEDRNFYSHSGFDLLGMARAARNNIQGGTITGGGSTITQQYAKNAYLTQDQTLVRKAKELVLAIKLETVSSKEEILTDYLNTVYFGRGAYGIETAAQTYFGVPASELTVDQSAVLAALLSAPTSLDPETNRPALEQRWNYVLDSMVAEGELTTAERDGLTFPEVKPYRPATDFYTGTNGYLFAAAQQQLLDRGFTREQLDGGGLRVVTSFDQQAQDAAVAAVADNTPTEGGQGLRIGLASVDPRTGAVVAMYGGDDYEENKFNNATQARGQAGSTFKAFGLAAGLGDDITLDTTYSGRSPMTVEGYTVENYANVSYGTVSMLTSTIESINTPFVQMNAQIGAQKTKDALIAAGIPADTPGLEDDLTNVLGRASPTPLEEATAFATLAARGEHRETTMILKVTDAAGATEYEWKSDPKRAFSADVVDQVTFALQRVVSSGTGTAAQSAGRPVAGKTGTSDDFLSAWFGGYTPQLAAAVMMVRDDEQGNAVSLVGAGGLSEVTGGSLPAQIFGEYIAGALVDQPVEAFPTPKTRPQTARPTRPAPAPTSAAPTEPSPTPTQETPTPTPTPEPPTPTPTPTPEPPTPTPTPTPQPPTPVPSGPDPGVSAPGPLSPTAGVLAPSVWVWRWLLASV